MKYLLLLLLSCHLKLSAQDSTILLQVKPSVQNIGIGSNPCFEVVIPDNNVNDVDRAFKEWMKQYDAKLSTVKGELFADNALMREMGSRAVDVYMRCEKFSSTETRMIIAFDIAGKFVTEKDFPAEYNKARELTYQFALNTWKQGIQRQIDIERKKNEKLQGQHAAYEKDNESLKKEIERLREKIRKAEEEIERNKTSIEKKKLELEEQRKKIEELEAKLKNAR